MRTRLLLAGICIMALPMWFSTFRSDKLATSAPFATIAIAGHTLNGDWCQCGTPGCICDPGEVGGSSRPLPNKPEKSLDQSASPIRSHSRSGFDFGTGALVLALALMMWSRLRA